tara:strand:+ start:157 stop:480 length:324 start_codon:yes stop_codon:yes gene_type:complete
MAKETKPTQEVEVSKEELDKKRKEVTAYYKEHIPSLKTQLQYEELLRDIEKCRAERLQAQMFVANTMAGPPEAPKSEAGVEFAKAKAQQTATETVKRTLKRTENATN